jgi:hypothetical protein
MNEFLPEDSESAPPSPPRPPKPSMAPSWMMLGFAFGALFILALPRRPSPPAAPVAPSSTAAPAARDPAAKPVLTTIENVFAEWGRFAIWENDLTEVALWNSEKQSYSDCYEVLRNGRDFYFRSIPRLTRPILTHGVNASSPLQFTETPASRAEWLREKNQTTFDAFSEAARQSFPSSTPKPAPAAN